MGPKKKTVSETDSKNAILALNTDPFFCPFSSLKRNPIRTYVSESKTDSKSAILALNMDPNHSDSETDRKKENFLESEPFGFQIGKYFAHREEDFSLHVATLQRVLASASVILKIFTFPVCEKHQTRGSENSANTEARRRGTGKHLETAGTSTRVRGAEDDSKRKALIVIFPAFASSLRNMRCENDSFEGGRQRETVWKHGKASQFAKSMHRIVHRFRILAHWWHPAYFLAKSFLVSRRNETSTN
ncbi:hypothetical protein ACFE04_026201 [Oxalis oulophora]